MLRLLAHRLLLSIPLLFIVTGLTFVLVALVPGSAATTILGTASTPEKVAALNESLGLNEPAAVRYWKWLAGVFQGDLGTSLTFPGVSVSSTLDAGLPVTLSLIVGALLVSVLLGVPLGVLSARHRRSGGQVIDALSLIGYAIPTFFLGILLGAVFSNLLNLLPASGFVDPSTSISGWLQSIALPVATLGLPGAALVARQTRQGMIEVLDRDFVRSLRARGLSEGAVIYKHALRGALPNVATVLGLYVVGMLLGTALAESIFAMQGIGTIAVNATTGHDLPMLEGATIYFAVIVIVVFALVDLSRAWLNPKLRSR